MLLEQASANSAYRTLWRAGTTGTITTGAVGGTAGNIYQLDVARCTLRAPEFTDRDGIRAINLTGAMLLKLVDCLVKERRGEAPSVTAEDPAAGVPTDRLSQAMWMEREHVMHYGRPSAQLAGR